MKTRTKKESSPFPPATREATKGEQISLAGELGKSWKPIAEVLDHADGVPTCFFDFDRKSGVGGLPSRRIHTVHGPTHQGKTLFVLGLIKSYADAGHVAAYIDAEHATPEQFAEDILGDLNARPNVVAMRPKSFEETIDAVQTFLKKVIEIRKTKPHVKSIVVVDSINKLVPERELELLRKADGGDSVNKGHGRLRAAMNQAWLDWLTVQLPDAECAMVIIAQEREEQQTTPYMKFDETVRIKGGGALMFDASMLIRVTKGLAVKSNEDNILGFAHRVRIYKNKVAVMEGKASTAIFYTSLGNVTPRGLDYYRDAYNVGKALGVIKMSGTWVTFGRNRWQGEARALLEWSKNPEVFEQIKEAIRGSLTEAK